MNNQTREKFQNKITQSTYGKSKGKIVVNSHFTGDITLSELIYQLLSKDIESKPLWAK